MERRELFSFLSSSVKKDRSKESEQIIRPPYVCDDVVFGSECQECDGLCATSCQEQIIIIGEDKTPYLNLYKSGCTYCDECANVCEANVLDVKNKQNIKTKITINETTCLSWQGVMCFSCKDPCLEDAIEFKAMFMPTIDESKCTSCGFCISRCPSLAINTGE